MPGFVSHTIMASEVYHKLNKKNVNLEYMLTYSLGGDLTKYAKCRYDTHHKNQQLFIDNMIKYIKDNHLQNDKEIMGVLYGHICHYIMDDMLHPEIRKIDKLCTKNKHNHTLIEEYYDDHLTYQRYNISKRDYLKQKILNAKVDKKIAKMLENVYIETYNTKNIAWYYRFNLFLYRLLKHIYLLFGSRIINRIVGIDKFLKTNKTIDFTNLDIIYNKCLEKNNFIYF